MAGQKFAARERFEYANGAVGWSPGGPFDCLGPYAKVQNCPVDGIEEKRTAYAISYADTFFSVPALITYRGQTVTGFLTVRYDLDGQHIRFVPNNDQRNKLHR